MTSTYPRPWSPQVNPSGNAPVRRGPTVTPPMPKFIPNKGPGK